MQTVLVTGAAGTVGSYVVGLAEAAGYRVVASDRRPRGVRVPVRGEVRTGDLCDAGVVSRLVADCDHVIHTAALLDVGAEPTDLARVNTDAVANLYEAADRAGAKRFVHMSTAMLYEPGQPMPLTEESPVAPRGAHGLSKHGAEAFLRGRKGGPAWTILRAAPVYGRRGRHFAASLLSLGPMLKLVMPVLPRPTGGPQGTMVHAEDVARALLFVLERSETEGQVFNVSDGDAMSLGDRIAETLRAYKLPSVPSGRLPHVVLRSVGRLFQAPGAYHGADVAAVGAWKLVVMRHGIKPALRPRLDPEGLSLLYDDLVVSTDKLRELGFSPRFPDFSEGWRQVLRWYQAERWVPRYG
jgi:nucleoside-diphosphate-sugar epimerase